MKDQPKPATIPPSDPLGGSIDVPAQPKPASGEWTAANISEMTGQVSVDKPLEISSFREFVQKIAAAHNAALAEAYKKGHDDGYAEAGNGLGY